MASNTQEIKTEEIQNPEVNEVNLGLLTVRSETKRLGDSISLLFNLGSPTAKKANDSANWIVSFFESEASLELRESGLENIVIADVKNAKGKSYKFTLAEIMQAAKWVKVANENLAMYDLMLNPESVKVAVEAKPITLNVLLNKKSE